MRRIHVASMVAVAFFCSSCSKSEGEAASAVSAQKPMPVKSAVVVDTALPQASVGKAAIGSSIPAEIKGFVFELGGKCGIDSINTAQQVEVAPILRADGLTLDGWALDEQAGSVPPVVVLQLVNGDKRYYAVLQRHAGRKDLVKEFGKPEFASAGYSASIGISQLPSAEYEILVIQKSETKNVVCPTYRKLAVKD